MRFVGLELDSIDKELERDVKLVGNFVGYKEMREKWGYEPDFKDGDFPLNSVFVQKSGQDAMNQQMQDNSQAMAQSPDDLWNSLISDDGDFDKGYEGNPLLDDLNTFVENEFK